MNPITEFYVNEKPSRKELYAKVKELQGVCSALIEHIEKTQGVTLEFTTLGLQFLPTGATPAKQYNV